MSVITDPDPGTLTLPLLAEALVVARRRMHSTVRVANVTREHEQIVDEALTHERIEIEHVPIGRTVEVVPPIREEATRRSFPWWWRSSWSSAGWSSRKRSAYGACAARSGTRRS